MSSSHTVIPLLLFYVGIDDTARGDLEHIKCDFMALDATGLSMGAERSSVGEVKVLEVEQMQPTTGCAAGVNRDSAFMTMGPSSGIKDCYKEMEST